MYAFVHTTYSHARCAVVQVWDAVVQRVPERARWIELLGQALDDAEERRREAVEGQLVVMVG
jgi:hypothetical protein